MESSICQRDVLQPLHPDSVFQLHDERLIAAGKQSNPILLVLPTRLCFSLLMHDERVKNESEVGLIVSLTRLLFSLRLPTPDTPVDVGRAGSVPYRVSGFPQRYCHIPLAHRSRFGVLVVFSRALPTSVSSHVMSLSHRSHVCILGPIAAENTGSPGSGNICSYPESCHMILFSRVVSG